MQSMIEPHGPTQIRLAELIGRGGARGVALDDLAKAYLRGRPRKSLSGLGALVSVALIRYGFAARFGRGSSTRYVLTERGQRFLDAYAPAA
jgi:hypothetical protein